MHGCYLRRGFSFVGVACGEEGLFTCEWLWPGVHTCLCMYLCVCLLVTAAPLQGSRGGGGFG